MIKRTFLASRNVCSLLHSFMCNSVHVYWRTVKVASTLAHNTAVRPESHVEHTAFKTCNVVGWVTVHGRPTYIHKYIYFTFI